jgi:hypothetical protein
LHEHVEKSPYGHADARRNDACLDFGTPFHFWCDPALALDLFITSLLLGRSEKHVCDPGPIPIKFAWLSLRSDNLTNGFQVRSARFTELQIIALLRCTPRTEHEKASLVTALNEKLVNKVSRRIIDTVAGFRDYIIIEPFTRRLSRCVVTR